MSAHACHLVARLTEVSVAREYFAFVEPQEAWARTEAGLAAEKAVATSCA